MSKYNFVHLHNHTEYSLLDGMIKVGDMAERAKELGMNAVAMTDHGNLFGAIDFYSKCKAAGVKPIIGSEYYMTGGSRFDKSNDRFHLVLLAKSEDGYKNLIQLSSQSFTEGYYYKPRIDRELIEQYGKDLVCLSACIGGEIPQLILNGHEKEAEETALYFQEVFGKDSFFLEIQIHGLKEEVQVAKALVAMSKKLSIPLVATNDAHYLRREDAEAHDALLCIGTKKVLSDTKRMKFHGEEFYFKTEEEMERIFAEVPKSLSNTQFVAEMCNVDIQLPGPILPEFEVPEGYSKESYLANITEEGLKERYGELTPELKERLDMELGVINRMEFPGYFLIVWDFIKYARDNGIWVGPGRGSGAGSIVAYALGITNIDPMRYGLLFERFLNEERVSMPDFDIDFCKERRQEVIEYVNRKYTREKVSQIVTFSKMKAKAVLRDVGRVMEIPLPRVNQIIKMLPEGKSLKKEVDETPELKEIYEHGVDDERKLLDFSIRMENLTRHTSVHAAGVVIGKEKITEYVPLQVVKDEKNGDMITTQFPGPQLEECGLVKMDFLGLITLTLLRDALALIKESHGVEIDLDKISLEDRKVYELLSEGKTDAIFQFESGGMQKYLKKLKPSCLEDLIAMNALYRPGPMSFIDTYIARKHGEEEVIFDHPLMEPILKETYGIMIYQEQVMQIAQVLAGYSLGSADILRRAMGKKKHEEMVKHSKIFVDGAAKNDISAELAQIIFDKMKEFANYGFNKSHATAYAYLAYQCAYLKAHYPVEFMTAVFTSEINHPDKLLYYINCASDLNIEVRPPDVNFSDVYFSVEEQNTRYALCGIKGVGDTAARNIVETRKKEGKFKDINHFLQSIDLRVVNRAVLEILIKCGACDSFGQKRKWMFDSLDTFISEAQSLQADKKAGQGNLFEVLFEEEDTGKKDGVDVEEWPEKERFFMEKEILGFFVSGSPLDRYKSFIKHNCSYNSKTLKQIVFKNSGYSIKSNITIVGIIDDVKIFNKEDGSSWARVQISDNFGSFELFVYKNQFEQFASLLKQFDIIFIKGYCKMSHNGEKQVIAEVIENIDVENSKSISEFHVFMKSMEAETEELELFKHDLNTINGSLSLFFHIKREGGQPEIIIKSADVKAPKDESICGAFIEKYNFIENIKIV